MEDEVTFYFCQLEPQGHTEPPYMAAQDFQSTYNRGNGKLLLSCVLEKSQYIIADDDAGLTLQHIGDTHLFFCLIVVVKL